MSLTKLLETEKCKDTFVKMLQTVKRKRGNFEEIADPSENFMRGGNKVNRLVLKISKKNIWESLGIISINFGRNSLTTYRQYQNR